MANRQLWKSPNGKYRIIEVKKLHETSGAYTDRGYVAYTIVQSGTADYWNVFLKKHGEVHNPGKLPKYVVDKARSMMVNKVHSQYAKFPKYRSGTEEKYGGHRFTFIDNKRGEYDMFIIGLDRQFPDVGTKTPYYIPAYRINDKSYRRKQALALLEDMKNPRVKIIDGLAFI